MPVWTQKPFTYDNAITEPVSPLILDLDSDGVETTSLANSNAMFDLIGNGFAIKTGWVGKDDGLLALDVNGNGTIDGIGELFGNKTTNGFSVLALRNSNGDNVIDAADADYGRLLIWKDANSDGISQPGELRTLADAGVQSISLSFQNVSLSNNGNPVTHRSTFTRTDGTTSNVDDVWFVNSPIISQQVLPATYTPSVATLTKPVLASYGVLQDIVYKLDTDTAFAAKADAAIAAGRTGSIESYEQAFENLLWSWVGITNPGNLPNFGWADGEQFATLKALHGNTPYYNNGMVGAPGSNNAPYIAAEYSTALQSMAGKYLVQIAQGAEADGTATPVLHALAGLSFDRARDVLVGNINGAMTQLGALAGDPAYRDDAMRAARMIIQSISPTDPQRVTYITNTLNASGLTGGEAAEFKAVLESNAVIRLADSSPDMVAYGSNLFYGTPATQSINGSWDQDVFVISAGGDTLYGGDGNDTYIYRPSSGNLTILESRTFTFGTGGTDRLLLPGGVTPADVTITAGSGVNEVALRIGSSTIRLLNQLGRPQDVVESVVFADGTVWNSAYLYNAVSTGTTGDDTLRGDWQANTISGGMGNDTINGNGGLDTLIGGQGNDTLFGGGGSDIIQYNLGDGNDTILTDVFVGGDNERIVLGQGISSADVRITQENNGIDLLVGVAGGGSLLVKEGFRSAVSRLESITFADGTVWTSAQIMQKAMTGGSGDDVLTGTDSWDGIAGGAGNDTLNAGLGNDTLNGGTGDDTLRSGPGDDIIVYNRGDGNDTLINEGGYYQYGHWQPGADRISFGAGIVASDLTFTQSSDAINLIISIAGGGSITVNNALTSSTLANGIYVPILGSVQLADGASISSATILAATMTGTAANDVIRDSVFNDIARGGGGDDTLYLNTGSDIVRYGLGDGKDTVLGGRNASIQFDANVLPSNVRFTNSSQNPYDLVVRISDGGSILFNQGAQTVASIGGATFSNGTVYTGAQISAMRTTPTTADDVIWNTISGSATLDLLAGNDQARVKPGSIVRGGDGDDSITVEGTGVSATTLYGDAGNDMLVAGRGADTLYGGAGDDILQNTVASGYAKILDGGDGDDIIYAVSSDRAIGGMGRDTIDVSAQTGASWTFDLANTNQVKINNVTLQWTGFENVITGSGNDTLLGDAGNNVLRGMGGNDTIDGRGSNNVLDGGDGNDVLISRGLMDQLIGGQGADIFRFASTASGQNHTIDDFLGGVDRIDLSAFGAQVNAALGHGLSYLGSNAFSGYAGELRYDGGTLMLDVNGDMQADFMLNLGMTIPAPLVSDFFL